MADQSLTLVLNGDVSLDDFAIAVQRFRELVKALTDELAGGAKIDWIVDELSAGSATAGVRGVTTEVGGSERIARVVHGYGVVGDSLEAGRAIPYPDSIDRAARNLTSILNGRITSMRFEVEGREPAEVVSSQVGPKPKRPLITLGAVAGTIETLSRRRGLRFVIYDGVFDKPVTCYLQRGQEELIRGKWGRPAIVEGAVTRDPESGRALVIKNIVDIIPYDNDGNYELARGAVPVEADTPLPEDVIRRLRDA